MLPFELYSRFECGDMTIVFVKQDERLAFTILPGGMDGDIPEHQGTLNDTVACRFFSDYLQTNIRPYTFEGMVQLHRQGDRQGGRYLPGESMIENGTSCGMKLVSQSKKGDVIETVFEDGLGLRAVHTVTWSAGKPYLEVSTTVTNVGSESITLDYAPSFMLGLLSPFASTDEADRYRLHRYVSFWSAEGRHKEESVESLGLERSWPASFGRALRFGERSAFPVKGFFPTLGFEDKKAGVTWAVQLAAFGPWELEVTRAGDYLNMSGGMVDHEFANWEKKMKPGQSFTGPAAILTVIRGTMDHALSRTTQWQEQDEFPRSSEDDVPVMMNEYCTTWGRPTSERLTSIAKTLQGHGVKYITCDAGWFRGSKDAWTGIGDWVINQERFPDFDGYVKSIYDMGMVPGFWFEFENFNSVASHLGVEHPEYALTYQGKPYRTDSPNMPLDFRKPEVLGELEKRVVEFMKVHHVGYTKIDYNFDLIGADTPNGSTQEGINENLEAVVAFYRHMMTENPQLVLEVCASGGTRLTPAWLRLGNMSSFSDAHEDLSIPVVAASTARQIPLRKNQVWATLRTDDSGRRLCYSLAAGFNGRLCLSGDIDRLSADQLKRVYEAIDFYGTIKPLIKQGDFAVDSRLKSESWNHLRGAQVFRRKNDGMFMAVVHTFADADGCMEIELPDGYKLDGVFGDAEANIKQCGSKLVLTNLQDWSGIVIRCKR